MAEQALQTTQARDTAEIIARQIAGDPALASPHTRRTYGRALVDFETWRAGRPLSRTLVGAYATHLQRRGLAPATVNHALSAVRWWARRLADLAEESDALTPERRAEIVAQAERAVTVRNVRGDGGQKGRHVDDGEIRALLQACAADASPAGIRDAALIALAFSTGLRRSELSHLTLADLATIEEGYSLAIRRAKGGKTRSVTVFNGAASWLRDWLAVRGTTPGALFLAIRKSGEILDHGLGTQALHERLSKRAAEAGVLDMTWHDARRTLAGNLLDSGADLATVQKIMGHASPVTTAAYDRRGEETRRRALRGLHVPYWQR